MNVRNLLIYTVLLVFVSCIPNYSLQSYEDKIIETKSLQDSTILAIIQPYKDSIETQMNEILCYTKNELKKGKPESTIGNFVTDLCLKYANADICLMNNGGLRTSIDVGNITKGKIYELMPFDNELVVVELYEKDFIGLLDYITKRGGEPFSGITITMNNEKKIVEYSPTFDFKNEKRIRILTSDYLANGGDKMWFFNNKEQEKTGIKIRDAIIDYCEKTDTININLDGRINLLKNE